MFWNGRTVSILVLIAAVGISGTGCADGEASAEPESEEAASYAYHDDVCGDLDWTVVEYPAAVVTDDPDDSYNKKSGHSGAINCDRRLQAPSDSAIAGSVLLDVKVANDGVAAEREVEGFVPPSPREVTDKFTADFEFAAEDVSGYDNARYYVERGDPSLPDSWSQGVGIVVQDDNFSASGWYNYTVEPEPADSVDLEGHMFRSVSLALNEIREACQA